MKKLTEHVYGILTMGGFMNAYVIDNGGRLTVIDTMSDASFVQGLEKSLSAHGKSLSDVQNIFITHCHYDHVGGLAALQAAVNAKTYAHRLDVPVIRGEQDAAFPELASLDFVNGLVYRVMRNMVQSSDPARVDVLVNDGDVLDDILPGATVMHLPGHTHGQVGLWLPQEKTLIGGDVMMRFPWGYKPPLKFVSPDWSQVKASIRRVGDMGVENLFIGHGQPQIGNAAAAIKSVVRNA